jgi:hypothetical protein
VALGLLATVCSAPSPVLAQGTNCLCRLNPVANYISFFLYKYERRDTCESPEGQGDCSTPTITYLTGAPGLPMQACSLGECQPNAYSREAAPEAAPTERDASDSVWAIPEPYGEDFGLHTISNSNPAYFALFPSGERPAQALSQDFTLRGVVDGRDAFVRVFKADISVSFSAEGGEVETRIIPSASGMEFTDRNTADNVVLPPGATEPAAEGQSYCRKFSHQFTGDREPTEVVVLLVGPDETPAEK